MGGLVPILNANRVRAGTKQDFCLPGYWEKIALGIANKFVRKQCRRKYCANVIKAIDLCGAAFIARIGAWALVVFLRGRIYSP